MRQDPPSATDGIMRVAVIHVTPLQMARVTFKPSRRLFGASEFLLCTLEVWVRSRNRTVPRCSVIPVFAPARGALVLAVIAICLTFRR